jgi:hypothetical protein
LPAIFFLYAGGWDPIASFPTAIKYGCVNVVTGSSHPATSLRSLLHEALNAERLNDELIRKLDEYIRGVNATALKRLGVPDSAIKRAAIASLMSPSTRREVYYAEPAYALYILSGDAPS